MADTVRKQISVKDLVLDIDNPRMYHHGVDAEGGVIKLEDSDIEQDIKDHDNELPELIKSIQSEGIREEFTLRKPMEISTLLWKEIEEQSQ